MVVTFCGHRDVPDRESVEAQLYEKTEALIGIGADRFLLGGYGQFDELSAYVVRELKKKYPYIESVLVIPYRNKAYDESLYDCVLYPIMKNVMPRYAIIKRNEFMVEKSVAVVAYVNKASGGAARTLGYAERKGKKIIRIN